MLLTNEAVRFDLNSEGGIKKEKRRCSKVKFLGFMTNIKKY